MTQVINDNVQIQLRIGGYEWLVSEAIVERSRIDEPDYVDMIIVPDPEVDDENIPNDITDLLGSPFELYADNQLIVNRVTDADEDSLLFTGVLANITPTGENVYEARAYDPSHQAFAETEKKGGSITNTFIRLPKPIEKYDRELFNLVDGVEYTASTIEAEEAVNRCLDALGIPEGARDIQLTSVGVARDGERYGIKENLTFDSSKVSVQEVLKKAGEQTKSEWWFDKRGIFHFGVPEPNKHALHYITDSDAGKMTPPYQSIKVVGSGAASEKGYEKNTLETEDRIVKFANLAIEKTGDGEKIVPNLDVSALDVKEPLFTYKNLEISTDKQAESTIKDLANKLGEQQAGGKITVVGFPEVMPLDGVQMPQAQEKDAVNYNPRQPMGGYTYGVYKVTHFLNSSDGFITEIEVAGVTGVTREVLKKDLGGDGLGIGVRDEFPGESTSIEEQEENSDGGIWSFLSKLNPRNRET